MKRVTIRVSFARRFASRLHDWAQLGDAKQRPYTHICDSVKRRLKADRTAGLQGEFGHRALELLDRRRRASDDFGRRGSAGPSDGHTQRRSGYSVSPKRTLLAEGGTEVRISPLLDGVRTLSGEKIQWYLAAELRDRIRQTGVRISIVDRLARKQYAVAPRQYEGRLLHQLPAVPTPQLYCTSRARPTGSRSTGAGRA